MKYDYTQKDLSRMTREHLEREYLRLQALHQNAIAFNKEMYFERNDLSKLMQRYQEEANRLRNELLAQGRYY